MNYKLRLKHPSGAEFEAEGPADFILAEKEGFLRGLPSANSSDKTPEKGEEAKENAWNIIAEIKNSLTILKNKHPHLKAGDAALLLLAADRQISGTESLSALALSRAIKASGYVPGRIDRLLSKPVREGLIKASGTKRNRAYQITDKGVERASLEAHKLK